jgi:hypothetical protein
MKLLFCRQCRDVVALRKETRHCLCGKSCGIVKSDGVSTAITGPAVALGFTDQSFDAAIRNQPESGLRGSDFVAFVMPKNVGKP